MIRTSFNYSKSILVREKIVLVGLDDFVARFLVDLALVSSTVSEKQNSPQTFLSIENFKCQLYNI